MRYTDHKLTFSKKFIGSIVIFVFGFDYKKTKEMQFASPYCTEYGSYINYSLEHSMIVWSVLLDLNWLKKKGAMKAG